jgi:hypothetical protein
MYSRIKILSFTAVCLLVIAVLMAAIPVMMPAVPKVIAPPVTETAAPAAETVEMTVAAAIPLSYTVSLDVNPSIDLVVTNGLVTAVKAFNDDGLVVSLSTDVTGKTAEEAVRLIVAAMISEGYIVASETEPYLIVTVSNGNQLVIEDAAEILKKAAKEVLEQQAVECEVRSAYVPDQVAAEAAALDLSTGRYIILKVAADQKVITLDEAIALYGTSKISELMKLFPDAKDAFKDHNKSMEMADDDEDPDDLDGMTPEQAAAFQAALDTFHQEIKAAKEAFFLARDSGKADLQSQLAALEKPSGKDKQGKKDYNTAVAALRDAAKDAQHTAIDDMKAAIKAAQLKFSEAKIALGLKDAEVDEEPDDSDSEELGDDQESDDEDDEEDVDQG